MKDFKITISQTETLINYDVEYAEGCKPCMFDVYELLLTFQAKYLADITRIYVERATISGAQPVATNGQAPADVK